MPKSGKVAVGVVVTVVITAATWIFLSGGALVNSKSAAAMALDARNRSIINEREVAIIKSRMDGHHAEQMQRFDRFDKNLEKIGGKIDSFHSK